MASGYIVWGYCGVFYASVTARTKTCIVCLFSRISTSYLYIQYI
uniref:Uncharacterized protein n=1 Tax=Anguilla anguilla TaxID=7936 RepID=A0A0E9R5W9_ANGAN